MGPSEVELGLGAEKKEKHMHYYCMGPIQSWLGRLNPAQTI